MNTKEQRVLDVLNGKSFVKGRRFELRDELTIREIALRGFPGVRPAVKADSQVRNSLRRLVRDGLAKKSGRGSYRLGKQA